MREQGVFLEDRIQLPLVGRLFADLLPVKDHAPLVRIQESAQDPQERRLPTPAGSEQGDKLIFINIKIDAL